MVEEKGFVNENMEAVIPIKLASGAAIDCVLDTGFNGSLLLPRTIAAENSMIFLGIEEVELVEKITAQISTALAEINWLGNKDSILIYISETDEYLIGTEMLIDSVLEIDYKNLTVKITK